MIQVSDRTSEIRLSTMSFRNAMNQEIPFHHQVNLQDLALYRLNVPGELRHLLPNSMDMETH